MRAAGADAVVDGEVVALGPGDVVEEGGGGRDGRGGGRGDDEGLEEGGGLPEAEERCEAHFGSGLAAEAEAEEVFRRGSAFVGRSFVQGGFGGSYGRGWR